jgi:hypothetical protein
MAGTSPAMTKNESIQPLGETLKMLLAFSVRL